MFKDIKSSSKKFLRGSHHKLNGFNLIIIIAMLLVMAYHISLSNDNSNNSAKFTTNKNTHPNQPAFFRYPANQKQKVIKKARQLGYADYEILKEGTNLRVVVYPRQFPQNNIKYKWILKKNIEHVSGSLEGEIQVDQHDSIDLLVTDPGENAETFLAIEIYREDRIKRGYVQVINLKPEEAENIHAKSTLFKSLNQNKKDPRSSEKKLRIFY